MLEVGEDRQMQQKSQVVLIEGPVGKLEVRTWGLADPAAVKALAVICHPHTLYGGTMDNKVVVTIERALQALGVATVCLNFRGAGRSEGAYDEGRGEQADLQAAVAWAKAQLALSCPLILAGFSFGSYVSLLAHESLKSDFVLAVAPPVSLYDFSAIEVACDWMVIQGGADEVIEAEAVLDWVRQQKQPADLYWRAEASHFFHRQLVWLKAVVALGVRV